MSVRGRLFVVSVLLVGVAFAVTALFMEGRLHGWMLERFEQELVRHARSVGASLASAQGSELDRYADTVGRAIDARVTIIATDGRVLGDSRLDHGEMVHADDHHLRPEIVDATRRGVGTARRLSSTTGIEMLYVAVPFERGDMRGFVRVAMPLSELGAVMFRLRLMLGVAVLLGLIAAIFMSGLASHLMSRTLRDLVGRAHALAAGLGSSMPPSDDLGGLAGSLNRLSAELERSVEAMAAERDRFQAVLDGISEAVIAIDADQRITLVNRATLDLLALPEPPLGRTLIETVRIAALGDLVGKAGQTAEFDLPGKERRMLARATPLGVSGGTVVVIHDVTEIRRLESMRRDFVANVSHELRTPVSIIRANAETLLDGALEDRKMGREFVDAILRHSDRLARLIADLLDLSRIEAGRFPVKPARIRAQPALRRSIELVERSAREKGLSIELTAPDDLSLHTDPRALDQVLANLLDNAVKYTPAGGRIQVRAHRADRRVRIEVADDGPGIEPRHRERIFERFYRVDPGRSRDVGGTGLGLSIVKHLVEVMGGDVGLEPATPHGSIFWFTVGDLEPLEARDAA